VTNETLIAGAVVVAIAILAIVAIPRILRRRRSLDDGFGAGGQSTVPVGSIGVAKTDLSPAGVVHVAGEQWTARSSGGAPIVDDQRIRVVGQDGLTLIVEAAPASATISAVE
jgi:membrane protein implicated in regulation of membrane protease activity